MGNMGLQPKMTREEYLKYGFVRTITTMAYCPTCNAAINAGSRYMPKFCSDCGQALDWSNAEWIPDETVGYVW